VIELDPAATGPDPSPPPMGPDWGPPTGPLKLMATTALQRTSCLSRSLHKAQRMSGLRARVSRPCRSIARRSTASAKVDFMVRLGRERPPNRRTEPAAGRPGPAPRGGRSLPSRVRVVAGSRCPQQLVDQSVEQLSDRLTDRLSDRLAGPSPNLLGDRLARARSFRPAERAPPPGEQGRDKMLTMIWRSGREGVLAAVSAPAPPVSDSLASLRPPPGKPRSPSPSSR
jgi:hypothetical protein